MDAKEIVHCALQIEKSNADRSYGNISTLLADLDKLQITAEQLEATDIVRVLYRLLKTCSDDSVKKTAKSLLSKWKRQYSKDKGGVKSTEESGDPDEAGDGGVSNQGDSQSGSAEARDLRVERAEQEASSSGAIDGLQTASSTAESSSCNFSSVRSKCVQLLLAALCPEPPDRDKAAELARNSCGTTAAGSASESKNQINRSVNKFTHSY